MGRQKSHLLCLEFKEINLIDKLAPGKGINPHQQVSKGIITICYISSEEVKKHCVRWESKVQFHTKMTANPNTGVLEPCICRVSVRREVKGGKTFQKLGFADVNLSEFAGAGSTSRRFLLEGYDSKHRQDNSMLKVNIEMMLLSGDPCFKVPSSKTKSVFHISLPGEAADDLLHLDNKGEDESESVNSGSSGFGSLPRKGKQGSISQDANPSEVSSETKEFEKSHSRNSSYASQTSKGSGPQTGVGGSASCSHIRQPSLDSAHSAAAMGHIRNPSTGSGMSDLGRGDRRRGKLESESAKEKRVDSTRVDTDELIEELVKDFHVDDSAETSGLQLYIGKDGTATLGGQEITNQAAGTYKAVVFDKR
ncbi:protein FAM102A-like [Lingula anatina]|uniref:Protein FAM102A-like n=1 Tax=Lingula anatina TaxID=7574 RepID=A0A1S3KB66_LINAN|nr:protein FAM102A-like [Lingula anatina]|eukprot:XP_013419732.1 protein FAM102A-like [Lingula anatina]